MAEEINNPFEDLQNNAEFIQYTEELNEVLSDILDIEPGDHPTIPEAVHRAIRVIYYGAVYAVQRSDLVIETMLEHAVNQRITEAAFFNILVRKGIMTADQWNDILVETTEALGGGQGGKA